MSNNRYPLLSIQIIEKIQYTTFLFKNILLFSLCVAASKLLCIFFGWFLAKSLSAASCNIVCAICAACFAAVFSWPVFWCLSSIDKNKILKLKLCSYGSLSFGATVFLGEVLLRNIAEHIFSIFGGLFTVNFICLLVIFSVPVGLWLLWIFNYRGENSLGSERGRPQAGVYTATFTTILLVGMLVISNALLTWHYSAAQKNYAEMINLAGRQRTHSQRIGWVSSLADRESFPRDQQHLNKLKSIILNMDFEAGILSRLISEKKAVWADARDMQPVFEAANAERKRLLTAASAFLSSRNLPVETDVFVELQQAIDGFQPAMERVVATLQLRADSDFAKSERDAFISLYVLPMVLAIILLAVILPVLKIVREQHDTLLTARDEALKSLAELTTYKNALENHFIVTMSDPDGNIIYANDRFCDISKYSREELLGKNHLDIISNRHSEQFFLDMWDQIKRGNIWSGEVCNRTKDGKFYWVDLLVFPMRDREEQIEKFVLIRFDITNRKNTEIALEQLNATLKAFIKHAPAAVAMFDRSMRYIGHTDRWRTDYNIQEPSLIGQYHYDIFPKTPQRRRAMHKRCLEGEVIQVEEEMIALFDGTELPHRWEGRPWTRNDGTIGGILVLTENISGRKAAEEALRASEERFRSLFLLAPVGVALIDIDTGKFVLASEAMSSITGYSADELLGFGPYRITAPENRTLIAEHRSLLKTIGRFGPSEKEYIRKDGTRVPVLVNGVALRSQDGRELCLKVVQDITSRRIVEERLWRLANIDALTGLPNRMLFNERLAAAAASAEKDKTVFAVGIIDVDSFKEINDSLGHDGGDTLLKAVAERFAKSLRATDTVARLGGDEFAFIIQGANEIRDVMKPIDDMFKCVTSPVAIDKTLRRCTISMGVTFFPQHGNLPGDLMKNADIALYRAKTLGRNRQEIFRPEMRVAIEKSQAIRQDFEEALRATDRLSLVYQPLIGLQDGHVVGFEALLRLRHKTRGGMGPNIFGEIFQDQALAAPVGQRVFQMALAEIANWQVQRIPFGTISINVTSADFATGRFPEELAVQLSHHRIDPSKICIEVTEGMFLGRGAETVCAALKRLKDLGIEIALDDFGTGFASLADLKKFPIDRLKIDKSFVTDMLIDESDASIVRAVIQLGHSLGMKVTAEGAENEAQIAVLTELGCDQVQGFVIAKPMPAAEVPGYLLKSLQNVA